MGKSESGAKSYNYYGTLVAAICAGPVDQLHAVIVDGKSIVDCDPPVTRGAQPYTMLTGLVEAKYLHRRGQMLIYWGTDDQTPPAQFTSGVIAHHPNYRGVALWIASGLLFGRERTTAPNVEIIVSRKPVAPVSLVPAAHNTLEDGQCNPVAALAELMTHWHGLGLPESAFAAADWQAAAAWCAANPARYYCSPLLHEQGEARRAVRELLALFDGALYWTADGKIGLRLLKPGDAPPDLPTLDAPLLAERARIECGGWPEVPTSLTLRYPDRAAQYKSREIRLAHPLAWRARDGVPREETQETPHVTRADQAAALAADWLRRAHRPAGRIQISVRRPHALHLTPGSKCWVDIDPEPGWTGLAQLCLIQERREEDQGPVKLNLIPDTTVAAVPYAPQFLSPPPQAPSCPGLDAARALAIPLSPKFTVRPSIAILAPRPDESVIGFRAFFALDTDHDGNLDEEDWADLGASIGFACRLTLDTDAAEDATTLRLTLTDGPDSPDAYLAGRLPDNARDAEQDRLLLILANRDAQGRVKITSGLPELEILSVVTRTAVDADTHDYTCLRGRWGTTPRSWTAAQPPAAYILPADNLKAWTHPLLTELMMTGGAGYLRLVAYNALVEDTGPRPQISFLYPTAYNVAPVIVWTSPSDGPPDNGQGTADPTTGLYTPNLTITDSNGDLVQVRIVSQLSDGSGYTERHRVDLAPASSYTFSAALTFALGSHSLIVTARDRAGYTTVSQRTIARTAPGGIAPPTFNPPSGADFTSQRLVTLTVSAPADQVQWAITPLGSNEPTSWPNTSSPGTTQVQITLTSTKRIWARGRDSTTSTTGPSAYADYEKLDHR
jgi:hypothetical protein